MNEKLESLEFSTNHLTLGNIEPILIKIVSGKGCLAIVELDPFRRTNVSAHPRNTQYSSREIY